MKIDLGGRCGPRAPRDNREARTVTPFKPAAENDAPAVRGGLTLFGPHPRAMAICGRSIVDCPRRGYNLAARLLPPVPGLASRGRTLPVFRSFNKKPTHYITACYNSLRADDGGLFVEHGRYSDTVVNVVTTQLQEGAADGKPRHFHAMPYGHGARNIWGVTAGISRNL